MTRKKLPNNFIKYLIAGFLQAESQFKAVKTVCVHLNFKSCRYTVSWRTVNCVSKVLRNSYISDTRSPFEDFLK